MNVGVVVLNYNNFDDTFDCIESLLRVTDVSLKIYLVDNASSDGSGQRLKNAFPNIYSIFSEINRGYGAGNNLGIEKALEEENAYILIINNDVIVEPDFLQPMIQILEDSDNTVGGITCKVLYMHNPTIINAAGGRINNLICTGESLRIGEFDDNIIETTEVDFLPGMLMLIRREVFETEGLFQEHFFLYFEDLEFSRRLHKKYKLLYTSKGKVYHKCGGGIQYENYTSTYLYYYTRNRFLYYIDSNQLYKLYVTLFSFFNSIWKTYLILKEQIENRHNNVFFKKFMSLWRGFFDCLTKNPL